jgi:hypothetical protein
MGTLNAAMGLQKFEQRLEHLVEGVFAMAFRGGLQPVELGRRLVREMDLHRTIGVRGTLVPNRFTIALSAEDRERFSPIEHTLVAELIDTARQHARDEGTRFPGAVSVELVTDDHVRPGAFRLDGVLAEGGATAGLVLADGSRFDVGDKPVTIGRAADCDVVLSDPTVSKHPIEMRPRGTDVVLIDLGSTNGTRVNNVGVRDHVLADGDEIRIGATVLRFEAV